MAKNLALTILIEGAVIAIAFRRSRAVYCSLLCNILTNPALNLIVIAMVGYFGVKYYYALVIPLEIAVFFIEAAAYRAVCGYSARRAAVASLSANGISFCAGLAINAVF